MTFSADINTQEKVVNVWAKVGMLILSEAMTFGRFKRFVDDLNHTIKIGHWAVPTTPGKGAEHRTAAKPFTLRTRREVVAYYSGILSQIRL